MTLKSLHFAPKFLSLLVPCVFCCSVFAAVAFAAEPREKVLYGFQGTPDGANPSSKLVADKAGHFLGTTPAGGTGVNCEIGFNEVVACGSLFELIPPVTRGEGWTEKVLYSFKCGNDGSSPLGALIIDARGNLYGTTPYGGGQGSCTSITGISGTGCGAIFKLTPPARGGAWTETTLHAFSGGSDGGTPYGGLIFRGGILFGTTTGIADYEAATNGTIFGVVP